MKLGLQIPSFSWPGGAEAIGPTLGRIARQADDIGLDSIWVMDHLFQISSLAKAEEAMLNDRGQYMKIKGREVYKFAGNRGYEPAVARFDVVTALGG